MNFNYVQKYRSWTMKNQNMHFWSAIIVSIFATRILVHVGDNLLIPFNLSVLGAPKIWYIVPNQNGTCFKHLLKSKRLL